MCFAPQRRCTFSTSQLPKVVRSWCVFVHFDFEMCFAPQRRALFRHRNFQKWSEAGVFCTFWLRERQRRALFRHRNFQKWSEPGVLCTFSLGNVLRATTACNFDQFCISHLARWLRTRRFSETYFSTLRSHKSLEKHCVSRLSYLFSHLHLLSSSLLWSSLF